MRSHWSDGDIAWDVAWGYRDCSRPKNRSTSREFLFHVIEGNQSLLTGRGTMDNFQRHISKTYFSHYVSSAEPMQVGRLAMADRALRTPALLTPPDLPPEFPNQRRMVARIEELSAQIHEARTLSHQAADEADALLQAGKRKVLSAAKNAKRPKLERENRGYYVTEFLTPITRPML